MEHILYAWPCAKCSESGVKRIDKILSSLYIFPGTENKQISKQADHARSWKVLRRGWNEEWRRRAQWSRVSWGQLGKVVPCGGAIWAKTLVSIKSQTCQDVGEVFLAASANALRWEWAWQVWETGRSVNMRRKGTGRECRGKAGARSRSTWCRPRPSSRFLKYALQTTPGCANIWGAVCASIFTGIIANLFWNILGKYN